MQNRILSPNISHIFRIAIGLVFGLILAYLFNDDEANKSQLNETLRSTLIAVFALSAFIFWAAIGAMRQLSILIWGILAMLIIGIISHHAFYQSTSDSDFGARNILWILPFLFITHELVSSGDQVGKLIAPYETYFDEAWKRGVQLFLAIAFTIVFWLILILGAGLLKIIGLNWFGQMIENRYFNVPATGVALAVAVHLGDVQAKLMNNFRNLVLSVFSWLLPIIVIVAGIFAVSLLFTGLKPLWETKAATASLLTACMFLVLLINAAFQDGDNINNKFLKIAIRIASFETLVFALIAAYSLWLRIDQYGLTHERILASIGVIVAVLFGFGYVLANFWPLKSGHFMPYIKQINIGMAFVKSGLFFAILTPIADPSRLSINSQIGRLHSGKINVQEFDFEFLKYDSGKYGQNALDKLVKSDNQEIQKMALNIKNSNIRTYKNIENKKEKNKFTKPIISNLKLINGAKNLPNSFVNQDFMIENYLLPACITKKEQICDAALFDINKDGIDEIILLEKNYPFGIFTFENEKWLFHNISNIEGKSFNKNMGEDIKIEISKPKWDNLKIGDAIYRIEQSDNNPIE